MTNSEKILGVPVDIITIDDIIDETSNYIRDKKKMLLTSINPQILLMAQKDDEVKKYLITSTHRFPDGIGIVKVSKWTRGAIKERVAGIDVMTQLLETASDLEQSIFLFGAQPDVVSQASKNISEQYPSLKIAGYIDGYTKKSDDDIVRVINDSGAEILFVALGSPRQEKWLFNQYEKLNCLIFQNVGGSFDVLSGTVKRAPEWIIQLNLEWLYRSLSNPKRFHRILQLPVFVFQSLLWKVSNRDK